MTAFKIENVHIHAAVRSEPCVFGFFDVRLIKPHAGVLFQKRIGIKKNATVSVESVGESQENGNLIRDVHFQFINHGLLPIPNFRRLRWGVKSNSTVIGLSFHCFQKCNEVRHALFPRLKNSSQLVHKGCGMNYLNRAPRTAMRTSITLPLSRMPSTEMRMGRVCPGPSVATFCVDIG